MKKLALVIFIGLAYICTANAQITGQFCKIKLIDPTIMCPMIYEPVCGCDGVTYSNACVARYQNGVLFWTEGVCGWGSGGPYAKTEQLGTTSLSTNEAILAEEVKATAKSEPCSMNY